MDVLKIMLSILFVILIFLFITLIAAIFTSLWTETNKSTFFIILTIFIIATYISYEVVL